ncbi:hypothetical protein [Wolbachia endosymbiont of Frankliniella intonsa]|uniref:hypothetical protein n=1 Tax=Wolbachia endosymbiont of Frankliniella intonsa TaxID=2902422 RepID=UPI00244EC554|nr:hypothetical protein [Wolbachia endosymbiont of Frankliniella intonsa]WGJ62224.1 hypothetical protein M3L71_00500 [Wolbachia endosymbiont of Frankliniella intonsa]
MNDSPDENYNGNTALECVAELYCKDKSIERKNCCEILIKHTLEKNPNIEIPYSVKNKRSWLNVGMLVKQIMKDGN